jgi:glycosyltransferase involved in cell wall biosynthesis
MDSPDISRDADRIPILYVITSSLSLRLLRGQLGYLKAAGFDVTVACSPGEELADACKHEGVRTISVPMAREIAPWQDLLALWSLRKIMRQLRPSIVNVSTPKAGLLGGLAAWACGVPCRSYTLRGLRCETTTGPPRLGLILCEFVSCLCANRVICVSQGLRQKAVAMRLVKLGKTIVLGSGSSNGVDESRFAPDAERSRHAAQLRQRLGIPDEAPVVGFVGRLTHDKGISELVEAYARLRACFSELRLLLVGDFEKGDSLPQAVVRYIDSEPRIIKVGFVKDPSLYYHVMDVLALPSHREGFPNVALEAQAAGKPVVAARSTGVVDAVIDGTSGILVPVGSTGGLTEALKLLLKNTNLRTALGNAGRERVQREFRQERTWETLVQEYLQLLRAKGLFIPNEIIRNAASTEAESVVVSA